MPSGTAPAGGARDRAASALNEDRLQLAVGRQRALQPDRRLRTIAVGMHVLFARPEQLQRLADIARLGDPHGMAQFVAEGAPAETAAQIKLMEIDLFRLQPGFLGRHLGVVQRGLRPHPDIEPVVLQMHRGVAGLHGGMRQKRGFILRLDHMLAFGDRGFGVAVIARRHHRPVQRVAIFLGELGAVGLGRGAAIPSDLQLLQALRWRASNCRRPPPPHRPA